MACRFARSIVVSVLLGLSATHAIAHTTVVGTAPKSGSVLEQSPPVVEITFQDAVRLTSVVVIDASNAERKLEFAPSDSAVTFKLNRPQLGPGRNEIRWKALSKDGHVISGSLILTIAAAAKTN